MHAKDLPDEAVLSVVRRINDDEQRWALTWDLYAALPAAPAKVVHAKCRRLIQRGLLDGCPCGCRGDFEIPGWRS